MPGSDNNGEAAGMPARRSFHLSEEEIQGFLEAGWPQGIVDNVVEFCNYLEDVATEYGMEAVAWGGGAWIDSLTVANATVELVQETIFRRLRGVPESRPSANATRGRLMVGWAGFQRVVSDFHQSLIAEGLREHWLPSRFDGDGRRLEDPPFVRGTRGDHDLWAQVRARELARALVEQGRRDSMARRSNGGGMASSAQNGAASSGDTVLHAGGNPMGQAPEDGGDVVAAGVNEFVEQQDVDNDDDGVLMQVSLEEEERLHRHNVQNEARRHLRTLLLSLEHIQQRGEGPEYRWGVQQLLRAYTMADEVVGVFRDILQRRVSGGQPYFPIVREPPIGALRSRILAWMGEFRFMLTRALSEELLLQLQELGRVTSTSGEGVLGAAGRSPGEDGTLASLLRAPGRSCSRSPRGVPRAWGERVPGREAPDGPPAHTSGVGSADALESTGVASTVLSDDAVSSSDDGLHVGVAGDVGGESPVLPERPSGGEVAVLPGRAPADHPPGSGAGGCPHRSSPVGDAFAVLHEDDARAATLSDDEVVSGPFGGAPAGVLPGPDRVPPGVPVLPGPDGGADSLPDDGVSVVSGAPSGGETASVLPGAPSGGETASVLPAHGPLLPGHVGGAGDAAVELVSSTTSGLPLWGAGARSEHAVAVPASGDVTASAIPLDAPAYEDVRPVGDVNEGATPCPRTYAVSSDEPDA